MSARWEREDTVCRADLVTIEASPLRQPPASISEASLELFGLSQEQIIARYGPPRSISEIAGGQLIYCGLVSDYVRSGGGQAPNELIFTAFKFDNGRLQAIRVGMTGNCPFNGFLPAAG
jgi:hypothetical protein